MTHDDIRNEPGAQRIAHRSTQASDPQHLKRHWTELEVWFRPNAGDRPPFVAVVLGCTSIAGQKTRETVTEAGNIRLALSYIGDGAPAAFVRQQALAWWDRYTGAETQTLMGDAYQLAGSIAADTPDDSPTRGRLAQLLDMLARGADLSPLGMVERTAAALVETRRG